MVLYRRDMLAKAGVEENGAFETPERFEQTLQQLQDSGVPFPLTIQTLSLYMNVHNLAMWVWHAGENLVDVQKKMVLFDQPKVRSAILSYLQLHRFVSKTKQLQTGGANPSFDRGEAAVTIDGPWAFNYSPRLPEVNANLGVAIPLGCSYIGGSNLVIWQQSSEIPDDMNLIAHLTSREFFEAASPRRGGLLPGRLDSLEFYPLPDPSFLPLLEQALKTGRTLPNMDLWGLVEDRFGRSVSQLWEEIFTSPKPDLEALYDKYITSMVHRLKITLSPP